MKVFHRRFSPPGASPGSIVESLTGVPPRASVMEYDGQELVETRYDSLFEIRLPLSKSKVTWVDIQGLGDGTEVRDFALRLGMHPLAVSDIVHLGQRPKVDRYGDDLYVAMRMIHNGAAVDGDPEVGYAVRSPRPVPGAHRLQGADPELVWEQVSLFLAGQLVLTVQEDYGDCLSPLRHRIRQGRQQMRNSGADYLATMVIDAVVDGYFPILELYSDRLDELEDAVMAESNERPLARLYVTKRELAAVRRASWPLRDSLQRLLREGKSPMGQVAELHLRDTLDHVMQVVDVTESFRELSSSLVDVHLSLVGQRTNEVMRVLTVVSAVFIPLTFLAGIYGMNFDTSHGLNMPELRWRYGYLFFWGLCLALGLGLVVLFRRLGWLGGPSARVTVPGSRP